MKTLGPATKAALARIVSTLPYLRSDEAGVPTAHKGFWQGIKAKYAAKHFPEGASDPLHDAALAHAEEELSVALEKDEAPDAAPDLETAPAPDSVPVVPVEPSTPPLGDLPSLTEPPVTSQPFTSEAGK